MLNIGLIIILALFLGGVPIWVALTGGGIFLSLYSANIPGVNVPLTFFGSIDSFTLMAITFFLVAGAIMSHCGPSRYIYDVINSWVGHLRGGLAATSVVMCMVYAAITGSSTATLAGVSEIALPHMLKAGYSRGFCAGLLAASCTLGQLIPPSIYMIIYGSLVQENVGVLFISGIIPGVVCGILLCIMAVFRSPREATVADTSMFNWKFRFSSLMRGTPALIMPVIVLGGIYGGIFTPTEAGVSAVVYGLLISFFIYKTLTKQNFMTSMKGATYTNAMVFILVAGAMVLAQPITYARIPQKISEFVVKAGLGGTELMFAIAVIFLVLGCFLDPLPILFLTVPVFLPALKATGVNLVHFNVVTILAMQIAQITPPFGMALYVTSGIIKVPIGEVVYQSLPYMAVLILVLIIAIMFPQISLFLPNLMSVK